VGRRAPGHAFRSHGELGDANRYTPSRVQLLYFRQPSCFPLLSRRTALARCGNQRLVLPCDRARNTAVPVCHTYLTIVSYQAGCGAFGSEASKYRIFCQRYHYPSRLLLQPVFCIRYWPAGPQLAQAAVPS